MDLSDILTKIQTLDDVYRMKETRMICIKYLLFLLNLTFSIFGLVLVLAGVVIQLAYRQYLDFLDHGLLSIPAFLLLTGLLIFLISVCGCCGSLGEHHCLTSTYSWVLGTLFLLQLLIGLIIFNMQSQVGRVMEESLEAGMRNFMRAGYKGVTETWNILQHELSCCGTKSYQDWINTTYSMSSFSVPDSCCVYDVVGCGRGILNIDPHQANMKVHSQGCMEAVSFYMRDNITTLVGLIVATLFIQFVGFVFSFCLANSIKKECEIV